VLLFFYDLESPIQTPVHSLPCSCLCIGVMMRAILQSQFYLSPV
jgi:hypothetical protein